MNTIIFLKENAFFLLGAVIVAALAVGGTELQKFRDEKQMRKQSEEHALVSTSSPTEIETTQSTQTEARVAPEVRTTQAPLPPRPSVRVQREDDD